MSLFTGCNYDLYCGKRPIDYEYAKWECEEAGIWFIVDPSEVKEQLDSKGEWVTKEATIKIVVYFVHETNFIFINDQQRNLLIDGECEFGEISFKIKATHDEGNYLQGQDEIVFTKTAL